MIEVEQIKELVQDKAVNGINFLNWLVDELKKEQDLVPAQKALYLEAINEASHFVGSNLKDIKAEDDFQGFLENFIQFIKKESLMCVATPTGRTALHWLHGFEGRYLVEGLSQEDLAVAYCVKDNSGQDIFANKDSVERGVLLAILTPANRVDFLLKNMNLIQSMHVDDLVEILSGMKPAEMNQLMSYESEGQKSLWDSYQTSEKQRLLKGIYKSHRVRWEGPMGREDSGGHSRGQE